MPYSDTTIIYSITDPRNNELRYIGKSFKHAFRDRCSSHKNLRYNNENTAHVNNWLACILSDGYKPIIEIVDEIPTEDWRFWEIYWIAQFKQWGFDLTNICKGGEGAEGVKRSKESVLKSIETKKLNGTYGSGGRFYGKDHSNSVPIYKICINTLDIIEEFECINRAVDSEKITSATFSYRLNSKHSFNGFYWIYKNKFNLFLEEVKSGIYTKNVKRKESSKGKFIYQIDKDTNEILNEFKSIKTAADSFNKSASCLSSCLIDKDKLMCGYKWVYKNEYENLTKEEFSVKINNEIILTSIGNNKEVYLISDESKEIINIFESARICSKKLNMTEAMTYYYIRHAKVFQNTYLIYKKDYEQINKTTDS